MWLTELQADRIRNLRTVDLGLPAGLTVITGRNGQGKTSLLEAVYLLGTGRSFRTRHSEELVSRSGGPLRVSGSVAGRVGRTALAVVIDSPSRRLVVDGAERPLEGYLGRLDLIDLSAERMNVLRGGPVERRRFLDRGLVGLRPDYLRELGVYRRVLAQRNALLRASRGSSAGRAERAVWDERLVFAGGQVHRARRAYGVRLAAQLAEPGRALFAGDGEIGLHYRPSPAAAGDVDAARFEDVFREALEHGLSRDLALGHTCRGPHRDELDVRLAGVDLLRFGSAGQVRAAMIALKLAKLRLLREERGEAPLFLMDDFDSDLDEPRAAAVIDYLERAGCQVLVATSQRATIERLGAASMRVRVDDGVARAA